MAPQSLSSPREPQGHLRLVPGSAEMSAPRPCSPSPGRVCPRPAPCRTCTLRLTAHGSQAQTAPRPAPPTAAGGNYDLGGGVKGAALGGPARRPALCRPGTRCPLQRHPGSECRPGQAPGLNCREPAKEAKPEFLDKAFPHAWLGTRACNSKRLGFDSRLRIKSTTRGQKPTGPVPPAPGPQPTARLGLCIGTDDSRCSAAARGPGAPRHALREGGGAAWPVRLRPRLRSVSGNVGVHTPKCWRGLPPNARRDCSATFPNFSTGGGFPV